MTNVARQISMAIGVFNVFSKTQKCSASYSIRLFGSEIPQSDNTVYAGCLLQANMKIDKITELVCKTARSKIHSIYSIGVNNSDIHPAVSAKIWKRVVLPSALYCEIWSSLTLTDMQLLEYVQRDFSRIHSRIFQIFSVALQHLKYWTVDHAMLH